MIITATRMETKEKEMTRLTFGTEKVDPPPLTMIQRSSFEDLLYQDEDGGDSGIHKALSSVFPIQSADEKSRLDYLDYRVGTPHGLDSAKDRGATYSVPIRVSLRFAEGDDIARDQELHLCEVPMMTPSGSFVINGSERVVISQIHRSPGLLTEMKEELLTSKIIPNRGPWLVVSTVGDLMAFSVGRKKFLPMAVLLRALGYSGEEIVRLFCEEQTFGLTKKAVSMDAAPLEGKTFVTDIRGYGSHAKEVIFPAGRKIVGRKFRDAKEKHPVVTADDGIILGSRLSRDIIVKGSAVALANQEITPELLREIRLVKVREIHVMDAPNSVTNSMDASASVTTRKEALEELSRVLRPNEDPSDEELTDMFHDLFFNPLRYDISKAGRFVLDQRLGRQTSESAPRTLVDAKYMTPFLKKFCKALTKKLDKGKSAGPLGKVPAEIRSLIGWMDSSAASTNGERIFHSGKVHYQTLRDRLTEFYKSGESDIIRVIEKQLSISRGESLIDDPNHMVNRRVRSVGEMIERSIRAGLLRSVSNTRNKLGEDCSGKMPSQIFDSSPVRTAVNTFFNSSALSQYLAQENPLSELSHKRRISSLGEGAMTAARASSDVREVHNSHYGRVCVIESPEGQNIGLVYALASHARINEFGFIESPVRKVKKGKVTSEVDYLSPMRERKQIIGPATLCNGKGIVPKGITVMSRHNGEIISSPSDSLTHVDVSPTQMISVGTSLIPFLEHNDASRALMGANMQRQAVPLLISERPLVGTGMESAVAKDSTATVPAARDGIVTSVDANRIVVQADEDPDRKKGDLGVDVYPVAKYQKSNQGTLINQRPIVSPGDRVAPSTVIADGSATQDGELALGKNVLVAFMSWRGCNFEDSILVSERLVGDDVFTSIHLEEFVCVERETDIGPEEITSDIPNVGARTISYLDECGITTVGAKVKAGDILVGKVAPREESEETLTAEAKLMQAIFGTAVAKFKDVSLRVPPETEGTVVDVLVQTAQGIGKDKRTKDIEEALVAKAKKSAEEKKLIFQQSVSKKKKLKRMLSQIDEELDTEIRTIRASAPLDKGVRRVVKVRLAVRRPLQVGDKMAGRHGNKGVISKIAAVEDMPFMEDGTPIDVVLSPLGVPSRMNVGQILETHLGWAAKELGNQIDHMLDAEKLKKATKLVKKVYSHGNAELSGTPDLEDLRDGIPMATPAFDGASEEDIRDLLELAGLPRSGQVILRDGVDGTPFDRPITVGYMYMMKLNHLVEEKMHARSTGPYSRVTQQPLRGKAHMGGQRIGEMEVWALEAWGASHTLQEMLTIKSDDVVGRRKTYKNLVAGDLRSSTLGVDARTPESFHVLTNELRALGMDVSFLGEDGEK